MPERAPGLIEHEHAVECPACAGRGWVQTLAGDDIACPVCEGHGRVLAHVYEACTEDVDGCHWQVVFDVLGPARKEVAA